MLVLVMLPTPGGIYLEVFFAWITVLVILLTKLRYIVLCFLFLPKSTMRGQLHQSRFANSHFRRAAAGNSNPRLGDRLRGRGGLLSHLQCGHISD